MRVGYSVRGGRALQQGTMLLMARCGGRIQCYEEQGVAAMYRDGSILWQGTLLMCQGEAAGYRVRDSRMWQQDTLLRIAGCGCRVQG